MNPQQLLETRQYWWLKYNHKEGIDCDEMYTLISRLEAIRVLLNSAYIKGFKLYQMEVKSAFLNSYIMEEISV